MAQRTGWLLTSIAVVALLLAGLFAAADAAEKRVRVVVPGCSS
ncbi:MAG: hypothetical protein A4E73_01368 [Syntrophaceae bacterium PtaU1.Bin231]|nr:MAG: hypothetical protein A4E73_01368 [Syntrophaceae bacterium PtaU1.Bin231]HOG17370.1 hypothetical protein [Syntrophales bacterium]